MPSSDVIHIISVQKSAKGNFKTDVKYCMILQFPICFLIPHASLDTALGEGLWVRCSLPGESVLQVDPSLLFCKPAASIKKWLATLDHLPELGMRGWYSLLAHLCGTMRKKVAKGKTLAGTCCLPGLSTWSYGHTSHPLWLLFVTCTEADSQEVLQKQ